MKVQVIHLKKETYRDSTCVFNEDERLAFATQAYLNGQTEVVLEMDLLGTETLGSLYSLTNSYDRPWTERFYDKSLPQGRRIRSTSVCDIISLDGIKYMVAGCGFTALDVDKDA